jgi:hypothetical protein
MPAAMERPEPTWPVSEGRRSLTAILKGFKSRLRATVL